jgi:hypothetical protein
MKFFARHFVSSVIVTVAVMLTATILMAANDFYDFGVARFLTVGNQTKGGSAMIEVTPNAANMVAFRVNDYSGQSVDPIALYNYAGSKVWSVTAAGVESGTCSCTSITGSATATSYVSGTYLLASGGSLASHPCPNKTYAQMIALSPNAGDCVYDTTNNRHQGYNGSSWLIW